MDKIGLVLEGGGMRGSYTAGALTWFIDHGIEFDYGVGISAGAMNLCSYAMKDKQFLYDVTVKYMPDKKNVGLSPLLKERHYVGYDYMFDDLLKNQVKYSTDRMLDSKMEVEIGIFNMVDGKNDWLKKEDLDSDLRLLKAACTLPIAGKVVEYNGNHYLDGGVATMVPVDRSIQAGCKKHVVIITKDEGYVRKPAGKGLLAACQLLYGKFPKLKEELKKRTDVYYREMDHVAEMVKEGNCLLLRPSKDVGVKRFSGDAEALKQLFELGYQDCENRKEEILAFMNQQ